MKLKRTISTLITISILCTTNITSLAESSLLKNKESNSNIMIEREDIPINEALTDHTFSLEELENSKLDTTKTPRETKWNVWGEKSDPIWDGLDIHYIPIGYSEHVSNGTVLNTYHYTRTYIQVLFDKRGDSDRQWGYKTVKAVGTKVIDSIWKAGTHMVKYGTQD